MNKLQKKLERSKRREEIDAYTKIHQSLEALVHISRDGCKTIRLANNPLKQSQSQSLSLTLTCRYPACKGVELLIRHFSNCLTRVPGGCVDCLRMWQLLELHSRTCVATENLCKVPLCRFVQLILHFGCVTQ